MKPCSICRGSKKYSPLGYIENTCFKCEGVGYTLTEEVITPTLEIVPPIMPLLNDFKPTDDTLLKPIKTQRKPKAKASMTIDHPLNKLKSKIANVNT